MVSNESISGDQLKTVGNDLGLIATILYSLRNELLNTDAGEHHLAAIEKAGAIADRAMRTVGGSSVIGDFEQWFSRRDPEEGGVNEAQGHHER